LAQSLSDGPTNATGLPVVDLARDQKSGLTFIEGHQATTVPLANDRVAFPVAEATPRIDDARPIADAHLGRKSSPTILRWSGSSTATQQVLPVNSIIALFDPVVDRLKRHTSLRIMWMFPFETSGDLVGGPPLREPHADVSVDLRVVHLSHGLTLSSALTRLLLSLARRVALIGRGIPGQLASGRTGSPPELAGDGSIRMAGTVHLRNDFPLFPGKRPVHRWDSVRVTLPCSQRPHSYSQRCPPSTQPLQFKFDVTE
jgi:hypothetical protein